MAALTMKDSEAGEGRRVTPVTRYLIEARAVLRAARHVARGESPERVMRVAPEAARTWRRKHPAMFTDFVTTEHRLIGASA